MCRGRESSSSVASKGKSGNWRQFSPALVNETGYITLQAARQRQTTPESRSLYALRAGIEGTMSQGVRAFDLRRSRYFGQAKTRLQHVAAAAAMNLVRLVRWILGDTLARTRRSHFSRLVRAQAAS